MIKKETSGFLLKKLLKEIRKPKERISSKTKLLNTIKKLKKKSSKIHKMKNKENLNLL
jgi:hypothetical protein